MRRPPRLTMSQNGHRLVVGGDTLDLRPIRCVVPHCFTQVMGIQIYDYVSSKNEWVNALVAHGTLVDYSSGLPNVPVALADQRVAYGMPGHHSRGCSFQHNPEQIKPINVFQDRNLLVSGHEGKVAIYNVPSAKLRHPQHGAQRVGSFLYGTYEQQNFGYSLDLSADGSRLVVGSPGLNGKGGFVHVYKYDDAVDEWVLLAEPIQGTILADPIGASVAIDPTGEYISFGHFFCQEGNQMYNYKLIC
mmetsp:Transcript_15018/g.32718  ORF Transcript_15018/g.32718 Transcript_15018/m.32718 type:complete len:246 (+) Transcript_15018:974-1711(+)